MFLISSHLQKRWAKLVSVNFFCFVFLTYSSIIFLCLRCCARHDHTIRFPCLLMDLRIRLVLYPTWRSRHQVKYTGRVCQKYDLLQIYLLYRYLGKHRLPVQGCHDTLITVHSYACVMKGFFGMSQFIAHVRHATFKNTSKVAWDKRATNTCKKKFFVLIS